MSRNILNITLSIFLIGCTITLAMLVINGKPLIDKYSESLDAQINTANSIKKSIDNISSDYLALLREQSDNQKILIGNFEKSNTVLYESGIALGARIMEKEGGMSPTDANNIINDSIDKIHDVDNRLGTLAKALNDASRK